MCFRISFRAFGRHMVGLGVIRKDSLRVMVLWFILNGRLEEYTSSVR
jgi:hypothetical protein